MFAPTTWFNTTVSHRGFPLLSILLGIGLFATTHYALAYDLYHRLPSNDNLGFVLGLVLNKGFELLWVGAIYMIVAGYDSNPFRVAAQTFRVPALIFALLLPLAIVFMPVLNFPDPNDIPNELEVQAALRQLHATPMYAAVRFGTLLAFAGQLLWAFKSLQGAGAVRRNAAIAVLIAAVIYAFAWIIGAI